MKKAAKRPVWTVEARVKRRPGKKVPVRRRRGNLAALRAEVARCENNVFAAIRSYGRAREALLGSSSWNGTSGRLRLEREAESAAFEIVAKRPVWGLIPDRPRHSNCRSRIVPVPRKGSKAWRALMSRARKSPKINLRFRKDRVFVSPGTETAKDLGRSGFIDPRTLAKMAGVLAKAKIGKALVRGNRK